MQPAAVILDFDGVVVDSLNLHLAAWQAAVEALFGVALNDQGSLVGHATRTIAHILCKRYGAPSLSSSLIAAKEAWIKNRFEQLPLLPGSADFLRALGKSGLPFGIASNSSGVFVRGALAHHGLTIPVVLTSSEVSRPKPAPDMFWECSNRLGVSPKDRPRILVFEDSIHGIRAAVTAGMVPVGISSNQPPAKLLAAGAGFVCADLGEALNQGWIAEK